MYKPVQNKLAKILQSVPSLVYSMLQAFTDQHM